MLNETLTMLVQRAGAEQTCPVAGDPDLYGLGIRLGIYIQMLAVQISALLSMVLRQDDYLGEGVVIFILAVGSVLIKQIVHKEITAIETAPMIILLLAQVSSCRTVTSKSVVVQIIYAVEFCGLTSLYVWYWWYGMDILGRSPCPDDKVFFFVRVSLWGWFRTMNKVFTVFYALAAAMMAVLYIFHYTLLAVHVAIDWVRRIRRQIDEPLGGNQANDQGGFDDDNWNMDLQKVFEITVNIGVIVFVEMTLKWNNITGVHSLRDPGQFMPLLIALAQLLAVIYQGVSRFAHLAAADREPEFDDIDGTKCIHDGDTKLLRRRIYRAADRNDVELASHGRDSDE